jgi:ketosteroid isomerase-like protein
MIAAAIVALVAAAAADASSPRTVLAALQNADNLGDLETVLSLYAEDAMLLPPNEARVSGKAAIRRRYEGLFARTRMAARFEVDEERATGAYGYIRGRMIGKRTATDGTVEDLAGKFVMLFRKGAKGWQIASLIWNTDK